MTDDKENSMANSVTFVHMHSESGDDYYFAFNGKLTDDEVEAKKQEHFEGWEEPEYIYVEHILYWPDGDQGLG